MHTNENVAIGLFKETMLKILLEPEEKKRIKNLENYRKKWSAMYFP
ncbi:MAG: hypothetical protein ACLU9T_12700 [Blautia faecis]